MAEFEPEVMEFENPELTRISPQTHFLIEKKSGKVLSIFKSTTKKDRDRYITKLIEKGRIKDISQLRMNKYGDLLKVK